ncbi:TonB-dependent receptor [Granulicella pectinivorans]|nr:TonB-dependent receptor [Granulicella pectinivorans]
MLLFGFSPVFAQFDSGSVLGTVRDGDGNLEPKASVILINVATGSQRRVVSNGRGEYEFGSVKPGDYSLTAELAGFKTAKVPQFSVAVAARQRIDVHLELGAVSETVTVSAAQPMLETDTSDRGEVIGRQEIVNLPLNGRSYADLALLVPGVRKSVLENQTLSSRDSSFNVNGQRSELNNFILDGLDNNLYGTDNQGFSNQTIQPSPDALSEFKVMTSNYSAEYGRVTGAVINVTTRSGTSSFHGSAWEYVRNTSLNAIGPFLPPVNALTGQTQKPVYQQNQFGGTFGGPLKLPFLRNKQFFFLDYEGQRRVTKSLATATLPDANQRAGRFQTAVMNPYTGQIYPVDPATGFSQVPASQINPLATLVMAALPLPNLAAASNNYISLPRGSLADDKGDARYDGYFTPKLTGFFRFSERNVNIFDPPNIPGIAGGNSNSVVKIFDQQEAFGMTYAVSNNSLIDARIGISLIDGSKAPPFIGQPSLLAQAGIPNLPTDPRIVGPLNTQAVNNFSTFGRQTTSPNVQNPFVIDPKVNYSLLRGAHSLKFGYEYQRIAVAVDDFHPKYGNDVYSGAFSTPPAGQYAPTPAPSATYVNEDIALTDFFFGARSHYELNNTHVANIQQRLHQWYAQDDWRVNHKLTLNIGLRYELGTPMWEANNQLANFDPATSPSTGLLITASSGSIYNRALVNMQKNNFAPRVGFAYEPQAGTVLRGGYGISYTHFVREGGENLLVYNAPFTFDAQVNQRAPLVATNPQPLCTSINQNPASCFRTTMQGYANGFTDASNFNPLLAQPHYQPKNDPNGYAEAWHLTLQQQISANTLLEIAYVGVEGKHLPTLADYNEATPQPTTCLTNVNTCKTVQARRALQSFAGIEIAFGAGDSIYHALQAKIEHRYASGFYLLNAFTWSHATDNASGTLENNNGDTNFLTYTNPNYDRGRSGYDQPINNTTSLIYDLPFGRGRRFGANSGSILQTIVGNWQFTAIHTATSGLPVNLTYSAGGYKVGALASDAFALTAGAASSGTLYAQRPNIIGNPINSSSNWVKTASALNGYLNPASVTLPTDPSRPLGNAPRNATRSLGFSQLDLGLHKAFGLWREGTTLDFRAEAFNALNQVNYQAPDGTRTDGGYGAITSAYPARQLQFAAKLIF